MAPSDHAWYPEAVQQTSMLTAGIPEGVSASVSFPARALQQGLQNDVPLNCSSNFFFILLPVRL
jgi:hypothetical protein